MYSDAYVFDTAELDDQKKPELLYDLVTIYFVERFIKHKRKRKEQLT